MTKGIYIIGAKYKREAKIELGSRQRVQIRDIIAAGYEIHLDLRDTRKLAVCMFCPEFNQDVIYKPVTEEGQIGAIVIAVLEEGRYVATA